MVDKNFIWIVFLLLQLSPVSSFWLFSEGATGANANLTEQRHVRLRRQQPAFCKDLKKENKVQEIVTSCTKIFALSEKYKFDVKDEPTGWENFAKNVISMDNIDFVFDGSSLKTIAFPQATVKSSSFTVKNNQQLTSFKITSETFNAAVTIVGNPILDTVVLEGEGSAKDLTGGELRIDSNPKLTTVDMDTLTKIAIQGAVSMNENGNLKTVKLGSLATFNADSLNLEKNAVLEKFELPKLASSAIKTVTVAQNRLLSQESIDGLNKITGTKNIQAFGECKFDTPIKDLSELNGCVEIIGDVSFASPIAGATSTTGKLKKINGNVNLNDLDSKTAADILSSVTITGTITSTVCDFKLERHTVASPTCPPTTEPPTTETATSPATAADKSVTSSGQNESSGGEETSSDLGTGWIIVIAVVAVVVLIIIIFLVVYCCVPVRPKDDKDGKPEMRIITLTKRKPNKPNGSQGKSRTSKGPKGKGKPSKKSNNSKNSASTEEDGKKRSSDETKSNKETKKSGENPNSKEGGTKSTEKASKEKVNGGSNENAGLQHQGEGQQHQGGEGAVGQQRDGAPPEQGQQQGGNSAEQVHPPVGAGGGTAGPVQSPGGGAAGQAQQEGGAGGQVQVPGGNAPVPGQQGRNAPGPGQQGGNSAEQVQQGGGAAGQEQQGEGAGGQGQQGGNAAVPGQQGGNAAVPGQQGGGAVGQVQAPGGGAARQAQQRGNPGARKIPTRG